MSPGPPIWLPLLFPVLWLAVTTLLSVASGWFSLARAFPDRPEEQPVLRLTAESGSMRGVGMSRILRLSACPSGLRVGMLRIFGPFARPFFVPWGEIDVTRRPSAWWPRVRLGFGSAGSLTLPDTTANKLWKAVAKSWPEAGPSPEPESRGATLGIVARQWLLRTAFASVFFLLAPRLAVFLQQDPRLKTPDIPIAVAVGFPAVVFAIASLVEYARRR